MSNWLRKPITQPRWVLLSLAFSLIVMAIINLAKLID